MAADTDAVPDASRISPPVLLPGFPNPVRLTMSADIDPAGLPLARIRCSLHATAEGAADGRTIVRLRPGERLDRDFILRLAVADHEEIATSLVLTPDPGDDQAQGTPPADRVRGAASARRRPRDTARGCPPCRPPHVLEAPTTFDAALFGAFGLPEVWSGTLRQSASGIFEPKR